tara:strand:+ start:245 stop:898 length:654 start_codon:yes stop_codon:yes gene_type:complete
MVLAMTRPQKHPKTGVYYFRQRVPTDLVSVLGKAEEKFSLRTKDIAEAKAKYLTARQKVQNEWDLATIRTIYRTGISKIVVKEDPTEHVKVRQSKQVRERPKGFTDDEAEAILRCALRDPAKLGGMSELNKLAIRWVPWMCAYTGARAGEITQLRREDFITEHGIECLKVSPEAGTVKTRKYRLVPLHPHLIEMGLMNFVRSRADPVQSGSYPAALK